MAKKAAAKLERGATCVQVWLITGYNYDKEDLLCGGLPYLGPYMWVLKPYVDAFIAQMEKYRDHVLAIEAKDRKFIKMKKLPTLEDQIREFEDYIKENHGW